MSRKIKISGGEVEMLAELNQSHTADLIWSKLPIKGMVNTWGEEIYFTIPVTAGPENAVAVVEEGDLAYWPDGRCFCLFFGQTPASVPGEIRPASPVNPVGRMLDDAKRWLAVSDGAEISLEKVEEGEATC